MTYCWGEGARGAASMHVMKTVESMNVDKGNSTAEREVVWVLLFILDINQTSEKYH